MSADDQKQKLKERRKHVMFYYENGRRQDAKLHDSILAEGDTKTAYAVGRKVAKRVGLTQAQIDSLYGEK